VASGVEMASRTWGWLPLLAAFVIAPISSDGRALASNTPNSTIPYVDLHVDLPYQHNYKDTALSSGTGQFAASMVEDGGLYAVVFPLFVPARVSKNGPRVSDYEESWQRIEAALNQQHTYARPTAEPNPGQVRTFYSFEGMGPIGDDLSSLQRWTARGVRLFGLVHNQNNTLATSSMDSRSKDYGLTAQGRQVVNRIYELGGVVDVSHASDRTAADVIEIALKLGRPVVASHSNVRQLRDHPRNLSDTLMDGIAKTGGIIGVNFHSAFLVSGRRATLDDVVRHMSYIAKRVGVDHVAIGSDFEGDIHPPRGLRTLRDVQQLVPALRAVGFSESEVRGIMGSNALRILAPSGH
jgi:membrane dipeptidase